MQLQKAEEFGLAFIILAMIGGCGMQPSGGKHSAAAEAQNTPPGTQDESPQSADGVPTPGTCPTSTTSKLLNFANTAGPILARSCYSCHATQTPIFFDAPSAAAAGNAIVTSVQNGLMPPSDALPASDLATLEAWATGGFPTLALADAIPEPTYQGTIKVMIDSKCAWCHSASADPNVRKRPYLTSYDLVKAAANNVYEEMGGSMPPRNVKPQLDSGDKTKFSTWMANGFPAGTPPPPIDAAKGVFWKPDIEALISRACVGCHRAGATSPDLSTYDAVKAAASLALADIKQGKMPKSGPLSAVDQQGFSAWIDQGMLFDDTGAPPPPPPNPGPAPVAGPVETPVTSPAPTDPCTL